MWGIPAGIQPPIFIAVVVLAAFLVRRYLRWGWLIAVWLGLSVLATVPYVKWVYDVSPLSPDETREYAWLLGHTFFLMWLTISGMVVWIVAFIVPPRTRPEHAPATEPSGEPEDTHELLGIPRRYDALLNAHHEARPRAVGRPWYRAMFRSYVPSYVREYWRSVRQSWRAPDFFRRDFVAAEPVLARLGAMTTAQLSAVEAYHRVK